MVRRAMRRLRPGGGLCVFILEVVEDGRTSSCAGVLIIVARGRGLCILFARSGKKEVSWSELGRLLCLQASVVLSNE